jgi:cobalamin-dependent methionine synthase I
MKSNKKPIEIHSRKILYRNEVDSLHIYLDATMVQFLSKLQSTLLNIKIQQPNSAQAEIDKLFSDLSQVLDDDIIRALEMLGYFPVSQASEVSPTINDTPSAVAFELTKFYNRNTSIFKKIFNFIKTLFRS